MSVSPRLQVIDTNPPEVLVHDEPGLCAYLPEQRWRLPLRLPLRALSADELSVRLARGDRRQGRLLYRPSCEDCRACEAIRLDVSAFTPDKTQRRTLRRGDGALTVEPGPVEIDARRVALYNHHKQARSLARGEREADADTYRAFLGESCCPTFELRYLLDGLLMGVALVDRAADALSAVYFYWHPTLARLSPGTYSILKQVELCQQLSLRYLYLGLYIANCRPMAYKARFLPHQRLVAGGWRHFDASGIAPAAERPRGDHSTLP